MRTDEDLNPFTNDRVRIRLESGVALIGTLWADDDGSGLCFYKVMARSSGFTDPLRFRAEEVVEIDRI
jgi:hypothetical protein